MAEGNSPVARDSPDALDPTVLRRGPHCERSAKELSLLEALMGANSVPLSAESRLEQVCDEDADPFTKTVSVRIGRLRRKLGEPQAIETVPGVGYRMAPPVGPDSPRSPA